MQVFLTRAITAFMGLITIGLAVITTNLDSQFQFQLTNVMGVLAGPILAVFLLGFFTTTANKYGAITGMKNIFLTQLASPAMQEIRKRNII